MLLEKVFRDHDIAKDCLMDFLHPVATALCYDCVTSVCVVDGDVQFGVEWHGSYQSEDKALFCFSASLLVEGQSAIIAFLLQQKLKAEQDKARQVAQKREHEEREQYERLKQKFEGKS